MTRAVELEPGFALAYYTRGNLYGEMGANELAIADFGKSIELDPTDARAFVNRGIARGEVGETKLAIADFGAAIGVDPGYAKAFGARGSAHLDLGDLDLALDDLHQGGRAGSHAFRRLPQPRPGLLQARQAGPGHRRLHGGDRARSEHG